VVAGVVAVGKSVVEGRRVAPLELRTSEAPHGAAATAPQTHEAPAAAAPIGAAPSIVAHQAVTPSVEAPAQPRLAFAVPEGRTALRDSVFAVRAGDSVIVHFDNMLTRTRRPDKFERVLRETLPAVYGARADSLLAALPDGKILGGGELLTELPARGIHLSVGDKWRLDIWPETRPGRDGPLVVRYRTKLVKG
jgi:hypothetical protein